MPAHDALETIANFGKQVLVYGRLGHELPCLNDDLIPSKSKAESRQSGLYQMSLEGGAR